MNYKKKLNMSNVVVILAGICACIVGYIMLKGVLLVSSKDNQIKVVCIKGLENSSKDCHITLEEGQKLVAVSNMKSGTVKVIINKEDGSAGIADLFSGEEKYQYNLPAGEYKGECTVVEDKTDGTLIIQAIPVDEKIRHN